MGKLKCFSFFYTINLFSKWFVNDNFQLIHLTLSILFEIKSTNMSCLVSFCHKIGFFFYRMKTRFFFFFLFFFWYENWIKLLFPFQLNEFNTFYLFFLYVVMFIFLSFFFFWKSNFLWSFCWEKNKGVRKKKLKEIYSISWIEISMMITIREIKC